MTPRIKNITPCDKGGEAILGPTIAAGIAHGLIAFAASKGADRQTLVERSGIRQNDLQNPDSRIPFANYVALMQVGQFLCNDPALALHFAEEIDLSELSIVGLLTHSCETMLDAFAQIARYNRLVLEIGGAGEANRFQLQPAGPELLWLTDTRVNPNSFPEATETAFGWLVCGARRFGDTPFCKAVHVTHAAPSYGSEYERVFRAPVFFESDKNALLIDANWTTQKVAPRQRYAFGILSAHAESLLNSLDSSRSFRGRVERLLMRTLHTGDASMEVIAGGLGVSRQTLLRRLKTEGVTFERTFDELRHKLALHYLSGKRVSVNETAYLLGFSNTAAFSRAFKRWTGIGPGRHRAR